MEKRVLIVNFIVLMMLVIQANASKTENNQLCTVCFEQIIANKMYMTNACNHFFCKSCLREWCLKEWPNMPIVCPNCRACFTSDLNELIPDKIQEYEQNRYIISSYRVVPQSDDSGHTDTEIIFEPVTISIQRTYVDTVLNLLLKKSIFLIFQWYLVVMYLYRILKAPAYLFFVDLSGMIFALFTLFRILRQGLTTANCNLLRLKLITYALTWATFCIGMGSEMNGRLKAHHYFILLVVSFFYEFSNAAYLTIIPRTLN